MLTVAYTTVKTSPYILKKYAKFPPSLILHLHPTHFRFEQQDGSFPYNSEMKVIIEHIRSGTVPHDMMEELLRANVRFYEGEIYVFGALSYSPRHANWLPMQAASLYAWSIINRYLRKPGNPPYPRQTITILRSLSTTTMNISPRRHMYRIRNKFNWRQRSQLVPRPQQNSRIKRITVNRMASRTLKISLQRLNISKPLLNLASSQPFFTQHLGHYRRN